MKLLILIPLILLPILAIPLAMPRCNASTGPILLGSILIGGCK